MINLIKLNWPILLLAILTIFIVWPLFQPGYFSHHDDLQVMRVFEMRKCFEDLQIPCRWVPDMGYGYGFPLFNYYNPFAYYLGGIGSYLLGYIGAAKLLFFIPLILAPFSMYFLGKELFGKYGGFISGVLYLFAPYRAVDIYIRGAVAESFSIALAPLVFLFMIYSFKKPSLKFFLINAVIVSFFLTSHNISAILFAPLILIWFLILVKNYSIKSGLKTGLSFVLGLGLSAYFLIPAFIEKSLVQTENLLRGDLDFRAHFVTISQLFLDRGWGYGASIPGKEDKLSFQIGWPHWWLVIALSSLVLSTVSSGKKIFKLSKYDQLTWTLLIFTFIYFWFSVFMMHNKSAFIWENIQILQYTQFPWRFLSCAIFCSSLLGGFFVSTLDKKAKEIAIVAITSLAILFNISYFSPEKFYTNVTDQYKLSGSEFESQQKAAIMDYLPVGVVEPRTAAPNSPVVREGQSQINNYIKKSNYFEFDIDVSQDSLIEIPIFNFSGWNVFINNQSSSIETFKPGGQMGIRLKSGSYKVKGVLENTPTRTLANGLTLISLIILLGGGVYAIFRKETR